jgi:hypothetical protein
MGVRTRAVDEIVDSNKFFSYFIIGMLAYFVCIDSYRRLLFNRCRCPKEHGIQLLKALADLNMPLLV